MAEGEQRARAPHGWMGPRRERRGSPSVHHPPSCPRPAGAAQPWHCWCWCWSTCHWRWHSRRASSRALLEKCLDVLDGRASQQDSIAPTLEASRRAEPTGLYTLFRQPLKFPQDPSGTHPPTPQNGPSPNWVGGTPMDSPRCQEYKYAINSWGWTGYHALTGQLPDQ